MNHSTPGLLVHHQLLESTQTHVHWVGDAIQPSHSLSSPSPPTLNLSQHQGNAGNESALWIRWPKYWHFSFNISPSNEHPRLISFRMDWLDLLAVQGALKILLQHYSSKASILLCSAFFIVQLSHPYMTTGKTIALTRQTFVGKVISLLFNMLSKLVITFLPRHSFFPKTQEVHHPQGASLVLCQIEISSRGTDLTFSPQPWSRKSCSKRLTWSWKPYIFLFIYKAYFANKGKEYWFPSLLMH